MRATVEWVLLPSAGESPAGRTRFVAFAAPRLEVGEDESPEQTLAGFPPIAGWPATLASLSFAVSFDDAEAIVATPLAVEAPLWDRMFAPSTRVEGFVREHPELLPIATFDAMTVADGILDGYSELAAVEPVVETPWDDTFWTPDVWGLPEPEQPGLDWITIPDGGEEPPPIIEDLTGGEGNGGEVALVPEVTEVTEPPVLTVPPRIVDCFPLLVPVAGTQLDESIIWTTGDEASFVSANRALFASQASLANQTFAIAADIGGDVAPTPEPEAEWMRFAAFNRLAAIRADEEVAMAQVVVESPEEAARRAYDFHRMVAALGGHPAVLRALGLIIDVEIDGAAPPETRGIRLVVTGGGEVDHAGMQTQVAATGAGMRVRRRDGAVDLLAPMDRCRVDQFDFEGAGRMLFQLAAEELAGGQPQGGAAPTLRTAGLRLLQRGSAAALTTLATTNVTAGEGVLFAEDVRRGARIDVRDEVRGTWASLHKRHVAYSVHDEPALEVDDEGHMHVTMTSRSVAAGSALPADSPVGISDVLASWDGWSLAAPRPGRVVASDPAVADPAHRERTGASMAVEVANTALTSCGLSIRATATPGSLPTLRFGRSYRMRMRTVDLAGQSIGIAAADVLSDADALLATSPVVFRRFEPVPPPEITWSSTHEPFGTQGETEHRLVVRSHLSADEQVFGDRPEHADRLLFPPACSVTLAEWHGVFDAAMGPGAPAGARDATYARAAAESGTLEPGAATTPYLADPASSGVRLWDAPGLPPDESFTVDWPVDADGTPLPLVLHLEGIDRGQTRPPELDESGRVLTLFLAAGERAAVQAASIVADLGAMALPEVWASRGGEANASALLAQGRHPQISPARTIELVHAVPRPLDPPRASGGALIGERVEGDAFVRITAPWQVDTATTANVSLRATWTRPRDDLGPPVRSVPADPGRPEFVPCTQSLTAVVGGATPVPLGDLATTEVVVGATDDASAPATLDLGFTGHVVIRLRAEATGRFVDFFPSAFHEPAGDLPDHFTAVSEWQDADARNTERPPSPVVTAVLPLLVHRHEGTVHVREGGWMRVWFARPWFVTGDGEFPAVIAVGDAQPPHPDDPRYPYASLIGADLARAEVYGGSTGAEIYGGWPAAWAEFGSVHLADVEPGELMLSDRGFDYDPQRDEWFMDVRVQPPQLAQPFVRLAVVRDQTSSLADAEGLFGVRASEVATIEPITLLPDRTTTCTEDAGGVTITVSGPVAPWFGDVDGVLGRGTWVEAVLQRRRGDGDPLLSWDTVRSTRLTLHGDIPARPTTGDRLDAGDTFPYDPTSPDGEFRLLIVERDQTVSVRLDVAGGGPVDRIVYAEAIALSRAIVL